MSIALVGGAGFIGHATAARLLAERHQVIVISRRASARAPIGTTAIDGDAAAIDPAWLRDVDAVVNLVGIKMPQGRNDFARAHEGAVASMIAACTGAGVRRFVHVGVVSPAGASGPYHASKRSGEALVRSSGLDWTILRPSVVYGPGDDMLTHLVEQLRVAAVFPIPGGELGPLQPIDVDDIAEAIAQALARPHAIGRAYDLVGPEQLDVRALVRRVAHALELPTATPTIPSAIMRPLAGLAERWLANPPVTRSQLEMLRTGLPGDPEPAARELELHPHALTDARIVELAARVPTRLPSTRLVISAEHRAWLAHTGAIAAWPLVAAVSVAMLVSPRWVPSIWPRMALIEGVTTIAALVLLRLPWRELLRVRASAILGGLLGALALWCAGALAVGLLRGLAPALLAELPTIYAFTTELPTALAITAMIAIVVAEDIVWRGVVTLRAVASFGAVRGCVVAGTLFAIAHVTSGPPLLWLAALGCGTLWSAVAVRTRSLVPVIVMHAGWDTLVMFVWRYG